MILDGRAPTECMKIAHHISMSDQHNPLLNAPVVYCAACKCTGHALHLVKPRGEPQYYLCTMCYRAVIRLLGDEECLVVRGTYRMMRGQEPISAVDREFLHP